MHVSAPSSTDVLSIFLTLCDPSCGYCLSSACSAKDRRDSIPRIPHLMVLGDDILSHEYDVSTTRSPTGDISWRSYIDFKAGILVPKPVC